MKKFYLSLIFVLLVKLNFAALTVTINTVSDTICQGTIVSMTSSVTGATSSVSYVWFKNNVQVSTTSSYSYAATIVGTDICVVIATSGSETSTDTVVIVVNPTPAITAMTKTVCSGTAFTVTPINGTDGIIPAGTTYSWIDQNGTHTGQLSISGTLINATTAVQTATYTVTPKSGSCVGATFTVTVTVNPVAAINNAVLSTCSGVSFSLTPVNGVNGTIPAGTTYSWNIPSGTGLTGYEFGSNAPNISNTLINTSNTVKTATYTVTPTTGSCYGPPFIVTVTVNPTATISNISTTVCSGSTFTVTPNNLANGIVPAGTTYSWGYPVVGPAMTGGAAGTNTTSISGTLVNATTIAQIATYTVTPKSGSCVGSSFTVTVTVNPIPAITNMSAIVCSGSTFTVTPTDVTSGVIPTGTTYSWVAPNLPSGLGGAAAGNGTTITGSLINSTNSPLNAIYTVIPSAGGCVGSPFTVTITVNPAPVAPIVNSPISYCLSTTSAQLTAIGTNLLWYTTATGGTGSSTPPTPSTATLGTTYYYVSQTVNGCESARALITVTVSSTAEAPIVTNIAYCQYSTSAPLTAIATGTLLWYSTATGGTGSANAPIPPTMVVGSINYYVSQTINGCASPRDTIIVFIYPTPSAPMISDPGLLCQNTIANPLTATGTNLLWYTTATGGIGSTIAPIPSTTFVGTTNYYVSQTVNGCEGPRAVIVVTVNLAPSITNISDTICNGAPFLVTPLNGVNGIVPVGTTYSWTIPTTSGIDGFQGGNNAINISGTLSNNPNSVSHTATYIVTPKLGSCVGDTFTVKVVVTTSQAPLTPGVIYGPDPVCQGQGPIQYLIAPLTYATSYVWTIPIGVIGSSTTSSINVSFSTSIQSAPIKVKGYNSYCGFGGEAILVVDVQNCIGVDVFTGDGGISISPNPVSGLSNLKIKLTSDQQLNICIYDITGRKVIEVLNAQKQRGEHHVQIDATDLKAGIYLIKAIGVESFETVKFSVTH